MDYLRSKKIGRTSGSTSNQPRTTCREPDDTLPVSKGLPPPVVGSAPGFCVLVLVRDAPDVCTEVKVLVGWAVVVTASVVDVVSTVSVDVAVSVSVSLWVCAAVVVGFVVPSLDVVVSTTTVLVLVDSELATVVPLSSTLFVVDVVVVRSVLGVGMALKLPMVLVEVTIDVEVVVATPPPVAVPVPVPVPGHSLSTSSDSCACPNSVLGSISTSWHANWIADSAFSISVMQCFEQVCPEEKSAFVQRNNGVL